MDMRNYRRFYNYNKALVKFTKRYGLGTVHLNVLFTIWSFGRGVSMVEIKKRLSLVRRTVSSETFYELIIMFEARGLIVIDHTKGGRKLYSLSVPGVNLLCEFETMLRKERYDK
jgi:Fe2+ or Zn2+ uptake regulation protein